MRHRRCVYMSSLRPYDDSGPCNFLDSLFRKMFIRKTFDCSPHCGCIANAATEMHWMESIFWDQLGNSVDELSFQRFGVWVDEVDMWKEKNV